MIDMQVGLLTLLKEFDAICRKHHITYYLEGGSLLGAIRHKAFLPWDDDVDLCMTREQFKKLLSVIDEEMPENRELYCYERFPMYARDTVKYTNLNTSITYPNHILDGLACGQHIDVFILDPIPSDPVKQEEYRMLATVYSELMMPVYVMCEDIVNYMDEYHQYRQLMETEGREHVLNLLREKLFTMEDTDECDTYCLRWGNRHSFYEKAFFGTPIDVEFEGGLFPAPQQYYRFLRAEFGDTWMIIPEESQQEDHNSYGNYHISSQDFRNDYAPYIDFEKARYDYLQRKKYALKNLKPKQVVKHNEAMMAQIMHEMELEAIITSFPTDMQQLLDEQRYDMVALYFEPYVKAQLSAILMKHGLAIRVDEPILYAAALSLAMTGRFWESEKLIRINQGHACCDSDRIRQLSALIVDVRACMLAVEETRYADACVLANKWIATFPWQVNLAAFLIREGLRNGDDIDGLMEKAKTLVARYPKNDELMKLMGDLLTQKGDHAEAQAWYRRCASCTRNGLLLMELAHILPPDHE